LESGKDLELQAASIKKGIKYTIFFMIALNVL